MEKKNPPVISFKKHQEEVGSLTETIYKQSAEIDSLRSELDLSNSKVLEMITVREKENIEFSKAKQYWETTTKTLHDELHKSSEAIQLFKALIEEAHKLTKETMVMLNEKQQMIDILCKNQRKWYHFF